MTRIGHAETPRPGQSHATPCRSGGWLWKRSVLLLLGSAATTTSGHGQVDNTMLATTEFRTTVFSTQNPSQRDSRQLVTLSVRDSTIGYVVRALAHQAKLRIAYDTENPLFTRRITVDIRNTNIMNAMKDVLKGTGLEAKLAPNGETLVVRSKDATTENKDTVIVRETVAGFVLDSSTRKGIPGATVTVIGTKLSSTTVDSGYFNIQNVPTGKISVVVKMIGYKSVVVNITQSPVRIYLPATATVLSGVVTTATGAQRRVEIGNDITVLNVDSIMQVAPVNNVTDLLATRVPGLTVLTASGTPGAPSRLRFRGSSSINGSNDPIVVVNGVRIDADQHNNLSGTVRGDQNLSFQTPSPLDQIDPNTIETIEVFKGPSASAMYGSSAANGVIVITTKRGRSGPARWSFTGAQGISSLPGDWPVNRFRFGRFMQSGRWQEGLCDPFSEFDCLTDSIVQFQALNHPQFSVIDHGSRRKGTVSVSGGTNAMTYSVTASLNDETGLLRLPPIEANQFLATHGFSAPGWMRRPESYVMKSVGSAIVLPLGKSNGNVLFSTNISKSAQQQSSLSSVLKSLQGQYVDTTSLAVYPLIPEYYSKVTSDEFRFINSASVNYPIVSWLPLTVTAGVDSRSTNSVFLRPRGYTLGSTDSLGYYTSSRGNVLAANLNASTTIQLPGLGRLPAVQVPVGMNYDHEDRNNVSILADELPVGVLEPVVLSCNRTLKTGECTRQESFSRATYGWYLAPRLNLNSRFFLNPGLRIDGGSTSGTNTGFVPFPKLDFSWLAVDRPEAPLFGMLTLLRPRIAFGIAGVQPGPGDKLRLFSFQQDVGQTRAEISSLGNTHLKPERSREVEGGVDADFLDQRLSLSITGYRKNRYDALLTMSAAPSVGGGRFLQNIGDVQSHGLEGTVSARVLEMPLLRWSFTGNIRKHNTEITRLSDDQPGCQSCGLLEVSEGVLRVGYPIGGIWTRPIVSVNDLNGNGRIDGHGEYRLGDSAIYLGAPEPNYNFALNTTVELWNSRLRINTGIEYENGMTQYNSGGGTLVTQSVGGLASGLWGSYANQLNDPNLPLFLQAGLWSDLSGTSTVAMVQTVNTLRWSSLSLSYEMPASAVRLLRATAVTVSLQGSNLALRTNYRGKDPNVNGEAAGGYAIRDSGLIPQPREWVLQLTVRR